MRRCRDSGSVALPCALGLGTLLTLPGVLGSDGNTADSAGSVTTVLLLLLLLLLLVAGLALAWRRLSRDSEGYYHPARLGARLWGRTRRLLWASPPGRWLRARDRPESLDNDLEQQEDENEAEDYIVEGGLGEDESQIEEQLCRGTTSLAPAPEQAQEVPDGDSAGNLGLHTQGPAGSGGSSEALLNDLHAFAGSAAWDDSAGATGGPHVTAL
ncbi:PREDICTED: protein tyrosine phosphatase receptor type C-associated protein [Elephantulus edwardii]|uniref:protein tyrosine phosphatase receptor type C-associated protein n=1 Tax=Elephantulus edwardii TaxID=28737 RepID=UPI0003F09A2D|nr:PREDICTED: protein tyrosine phosphatase receptor type C-associated protein [Elephantulus edwardii]